MKPSKPEPRVVGPFVHPREWGGMLFAADMRLLAVTLRGALVWVYAGSMWGGALSGTVPVPGELLYLPFKEGTQVPTSNAHTRLHEGGRLSKELLATYQEQIDEWLGKGRAQLVDSRKCVLFDGVDIPPGSVLPEPKSAGSSGVPDDIDLDAVRETCAAIAAVIAQNGEATSIPSTITVNGVGVQVKVSRPFRATDYRVRFQLDTQPAATLHPDLVEAQRDKLKALLAEYRAQVPVVYGAPLVSVEARFSPSNAVLASWTSEHGAAIRKALARECKEWRVAAVSTDDPLLLIVMCTKPSHS